MAKVVKKKTTAKATKKTTRARAVKKVRKNIVPSNL